jgi:uncharacterized protein GlcG (DUF336 family)
MTALLTLDEASRIVDAALAEGQKQGFAPLCVVVLDTGGHVLALKRSERASISRPEIATAKAAGCLGLGFGGGELARRAQTNPGFYAAIAAVFPRGIVPVAGGVLVRGTAGELVGAVGISGDTSEHDEICAVAGIRAVALVPDTGDPA